MNIVGIIAEYNPMHNGHIYHIKKAKELSQADYVVVIMSGSFTEQGNISTLDKFTRAKLAIQNGADLVIELPTIHATASAEGFAKGAVNILNSLGCITHLAFGAETDELDVLQKIAKTCIEKSTDIINNSKSYLKQGVTAATARDMALKDILSSNYYEEINKPNNILGIEYLKALYELKSQIKPVLVHRTNSIHNNLKIANNCEYASSTAVREALSNNSLTLEQRLKNIQPVVPKNVISELSQNTFKTNEHIWEILKYEILKLGKDGLKNIAEVNEGLENRLFAASYSCNSYNEYISKVKCKRYTLSRIKRICVYILLGITKDLKESIKDVNYCKVLKIKKGSSKLLSLIANNATNTVITKLTDKTTMGFSNINIAQSIKLDVMANNITYIPLKDYTNIITC